MGDSVRVENFGRSGATLLTVGDLPYTDQSQYTAATQFVDNAGADAVVSVVIVLGANDSKPYNWDVDGRPEQFLADYFALVDHFLGLSTKPTVYVALPLATGNNPCCDIRGEVILDEQVPLIMQVAEERRLPIIDLNSPTLDHPEYFGDGVHPNDGGYAVLAELVKTGLEREPSASIEMPAANASLPAGLVPITVAVSGDTVDIASVEFFDGDVSLGTETESPFEFAWQASVGTHELTIKATDTTLADSTSEPRGVTVTEAESGGAGGSAGAGGVANVGGTAGAGGAANVGGSAGAGGAGSGGTTGLGGAGPAALGGMGGGSGVAGGPAGAGNTPLPDTTVQPPVGDNMPVGDVAPAPSAQGPAVDGVGAPTAAPASATPVPSASGSAAPMTTSSGDDGGCASVPLAKSHPRGAWLLLGLFAVALGKRRRRRS